MVRNTRTLMMCSLLAVATAAVLGSRMVPAVDDAARGSTFGVLPAAASPDSIADSAGANLPASEVALHPAEGNRQPRGPRGSRESLARPMR